jgi:hypothetical protein
VPRQWYTIDGIGLWKVGIKEEDMKKSWTKPTMCQVAAGMEISRYLPAEITPKK